MSKHTPGPWKIVDAWNDYMVEGQNGEEIIWQDGPHETPTINEANARLIAAAPELLEALEEYHRTANSVSYVQWTPAMHKAKAAIAKARGQE